ncbi:MAG: hypothetical protein KDB58_04095 [Solirubrobacterales bacterium]|nr:hypothetical protein [Solirubrobacterales bacterium]MCB8971025.1 hypothetical protein [Thermoleophilales bacterium]MCO5326081.1 hypothetical protein [Solirubrobacterales bacterium]
MIAATVDPTSHLFWLASRSLGIVALLLTSASVGFGLALSTRISKRPGMAARFKVLHEAVALVSLGAIAGHGLLLLGDSFLHPTVAEITVPFAMHVNPIWTGLGVIAGWLALAFSLSFYVRKWIGVALWRKLHRWTALVFVLGFAHAIGSGSDTRSTWLIAMLALAAAPAALLGSLRLAGLGTTTRPTRARTAPPVA